MLFSYGYGSGQQRIDDNNKCGQIAGDFDCHAAHRPVERICGFMQSQ